LGGNYTGVKEERASLLVVTFREWKGGKGRGTRGRDWGRGTERKVETSNQRDWWSEVEKERQKRLQDLVSFSNMGVQKRHRTGKEEVTIVASKIMCTFQETSKETCQRTKERGGGGYVGGNGLLNGLDHGNLSQNRVRRPWRGGVQNGGFRPDVGKKGVVRFKNKENGKKNGGTRRGKGEGLREVVTLRYHPPEDPSEEVWGKGMKRNIVGTRFN